MPQTKSLEEPTNLLTFFRRELKEAFDDVGVDAAEETEAYIVHLLNGFACIEAERIDEIGFDKPAAILLGEANNATGERRVEAYRRVGDLSLFNCGFFGEYLTRRCMSEEYYRDIGQIAYKKLNDLISHKQSGGSFPSVFDELVVKFGEFVEALKRLGQEPTDQSPKDALMEQKLEDLPGVDSEDLKGVTVEELFFGTEPDFES